MTLENEQVNQPALRFPVFINPWKSLRLEKVSIDGFNNGVFNDPKKVGQGYRLINVKDMYVGDCIDVDNLSLLDITEKDFKKNKVNYGDIFFTRSSIVAAGIAHCSVNLNTSDDITYDGHLIRMRPDIEQYSPRFLISLLKTATVRKQLISRGKTTTMTTIGQADISSTLITFPCIEEQKKIASFLSSVDIKIQQLKRKHTLMKQYKKGVMQQLFTQQVRFKDDKGCDYPCWDEQLASKLFKSNSDKNHDGSLRILAATQDRGMMYRDETGIEIQSSEASVKSYKLVQKGDFVISLRSFQGGIEYSDLKGICSPAYTVLQPKTKICHSFFQQYFKKEDFISRLSMTVVGIRDGKQISYSAFSGLKLKYPCVEEQQKIANFLTSIDKKIQQLDTKIIQAEIFKKGLLQQMFV